MRVQMVLLTMSSIPTRTLLLPSYLLCSHSLSIFIFNGGYRNTTLFCWAKVCHRIIFFFFCKLQIAPLKFEVFKFYILKFRFYTNILKFKFYPLKFKNAWILYPQIIKFQGVKSKHPKTLRNKIQTLLRYKR